MRLAEKVAIITGAGSGIGRASAILFAQEGAKVVVVDIEHLAGQKTVDTISANGGKAVFIHCNVTKADEVEKMTRTAVEKFGRLNIIFNCAGLPQMTKPLELINEEEWDNIFAVNVKSIFLGAKYALPELKKTGNGAIINIASVAGIRPGPGRICYSASKGAVITITKALAVELAPFNIRVNCINPGPTDTPMLPKFFPGFNEEFKQAIKSDTPLGRIVKPENIADAALYLASDEASAVTGVALNVDSGFLIGRAR